jgi:Fe-S cluster assembly protein SufB
MAPQYTENELAKDLENQDYKFGFVTDVETETIPKGLSEDIIRLISSKKEEPEWLLKYRLDSFQIWLKMTEPSWAHLKYEKPNFQDITYFAAPKQTKKYESWDDVDPEMKETMAKLGISLEEQKKLTGVAVDFVMDSVPLQHLSNQSSKSLELSSVHFRRPCKNTQNSLENTWAQSFRIQTIIMRH